MVYAERPLYLSFLWQNKDKENIKILNGLRGTGKTTLLQQYRHTLIESGVPEKQVLYLDLSHPVSEVFPDGRTLFHHICLQYPTNKKLYLLLDEVQCLPGFEQLVDNLFLRKHIDLCLAGSGPGPALPSLQKLLPGRCVIRTVYPLSFPEYLSTADSEDNDLPLQLRTYITRSTLPGTLSAEDGSCTQNVLDSAAFRDICLRSRSIHPALLHRLITCLAKASGASITFQSLTEILGRTGRPLLMKTVRTYAKALTDSGLFQYVPLNSSEEEGYFYMTDPGMLPLFVLAKNLSGETLLRHIVLLELRRRFGQVTSLRTKTGSIDFVTESMGLRTFWQFLPDPANKNSAQKMKALQESDPSAEKCILTLSPTMFPAEPGAAVLDLIPWLLK